MLPETRGIRLPAPMFTTNQNAPMFTKNQKCLHTYMHACIHSYIYVHIVIYVYMFSVFCMKVYGMAVDKQLNGSILYIYRCTYKDRGVYE